MVSNKRFYHNQPKYWHEYAENFDGESDDDVGNDTEDSAVPEGLQDSFDKLEGDVVT
jgi:hypothetical protein